MRSPLVSVIIRCYNERENIGKLLHGIREQSIDDVEIILVDSGSTDGTLAVAKEFGVDGIEYIAPEKFSFGRSLNYGCDAASGEFCVVASAHVYPRRDDWLESLLLPFWEDESGELALVYGKQRGNAVTSFSEKQIFRQWFPDHDICRQSHPFCNNANAAIRRDLWEEFPYDEELTGLEDVDWAKRIQEAGYAISYAADAEVIHVHDESPQEVYRRYRREAFAHKQILDDQSFSLFDFLVLTIRHVIGDYRTAFAERSLTSNLVEIPMFRVLQFWGTYRGFNQEGPVSRQLWQRFYYPDRDGFPSRDGGGNSSMEYGGEEASVIDYSGLFDNSREFSLDHESR